MILVISSSLNSSSNSRILARETFRVLERDGIPATFLDLRELPLPFCDGGPAYTHTNVASAKKLIHDATGIIVAVPIYNFMVNAAVKNLVEMTGEAWEGKVVGFLCAAGGRSSYMSVMSFANGLMLDYRTLIVPRFVYASGDAFEGDTISDPETVGRVAEVARMTVKLGRALQAA
jgi:FMN reductase